MSPGSPGTERDGAGVRGARHVGNDKTVRIPDQSYYRVPTLSGNENKTFIRPDFVQNNTSLCVGEFQ